MSEDSKHKNKELDGKNDNILLMAKDVLSKSDKLSVYHLSNIKIIA